eukprot:gene863-30429_t
MGGGSSVNQVEQARFYEPSRWLPKAKLSPDESAMLKAVWKEGEEEGATNVQRLQKMCNKRRCDRSQSAYLCSVVVEESLTYDACCRLTSVLSGGHEKDRRRLWFECIDRDGDQSLDLEELAVAVRMMTPRTDRSFWTRTARDIMLAGDANGDGKINLDEWEAASEERVAKDEMRGIDPTVRKKAEAPVLQDVVNPLPGIHPIMKTDKADPDSYYGHRTPKEYLSHLITKELSDAFDVQG